MEAKKEKTQVSKTPREVALENALTLRNYFTSIGIHSKDWMVVGSSVLAVAGLPMTEAPHDIDVEVTAMDSKCIFDALQKMNPKQASKDDYEFTNSYPYIFDLGSLRVNVWVTEKFTHKIAFYYDYVQYAPIDSVLKVKLSYKRPKDSRDLLNIIKNLANLA